MRLGAELQRRGHRVVVFTHAPAERHPEAPTVPVHAVPDDGPLTIAAALARAITPDEFSHALIQYTPQMWGASRFGSPALPLLAASLRRQGVRVGAILHEMYTPWFNRPDLAIGSTALRLQLGALLSSCDHIWLTTDSRREIIEADVAALSPPRALSTYRIGPGALPESAKPGHAEGPRLGLFSTLAVGKAFDVVVAAFSEIVRVHPRAQLILLGDLGPPGNRGLTMLQAQIAATGAADRVRLTGKLPLPEVARQVASLDLYLFPMSTGANTRSSTLPLALGAGVPVVAIRGPETDPLFVHGRNVFFADALTAPAFARAAQAMLANRELAARVAAGGQALYAQHLAWDGIADTLLESLV